MWSLATCSTDMIRDRETYNSRATVIKALAHPSRLVILDALAGGEQCVRELQRVLGIDMSTVSRHLALMKSAGILADRKEGQQVFYRLRWPPILDLLDVVESVIQEDVRRKRGALRQKARR